MQDRISAGATRKRAIDWTQEALGATRWCLDKLWDANAGKFHPASPMDPKALPYDFMWGNGVAFSMLVGATRYDRATYQPYLLKFFEGLDSHWDKWAPIPAYDAYFASKNGDDKYYDDNEWMVLTFVEGYTLTKDRRLLVRAIETQDYVLSGWDDKLGGGIYWRQDHKSKNTCSNGPGAASALALARHIKRDFYITWAKRIVDWTRKTFQDTDGLYVDNINVETMKVDRMKWTYNTALMLRSHVDLYRLTGNKADMEEAKRLALASEKFFVRPETNAFRDEANFSHLLCEAYLELYRETKEPYLLKRVEANGQFAVTQLKDKDGGYFTKWDAKPNRNEPRKSLMANGSTARLLWLLADVTSTKA